MKFAMAFLVICCALSLAGAPGGRAVTFSPGIPGFFLPELGIEFPVSEKDRIGLAVSTIMLSMNYELTYTRLMGSLELRGTIGYLPEVPDDEDWLVDIFDQSILITATCGYRHQADNGFIFRAAAGVGFFDSFENSDQLLIPTAQIGIGYAF